MLELYVDLEQFDLFELCYPPGLTWLVTWRVSQFQIRPGYLWPIEDVGQSRYSLQAAGDFRPLMRIRMLSP